ncbi:MAG: DUF1287 domain-containing protein [Pseudomonadota bacterium]
MRDHLVLGALLAAPAAALTAVLLVAKSVSMITTDQTPRVASAAPAFRVPELQLRLPQSAPLTADEPELGGSRLMLTRTAPAIHVAALPQTATTLRIGARPPAVAVARVELASVSALRRGPAPPARIDEIVPPPAQTAIVALRSEAALRAIAQPRPGTALAMAAAAPDVQTPALGDGPGPITLLSDAPPVAAVAVALATPAFGLDGRPPRLGMTRLRLAGVDHALPAAGPDLRATARPRIPTTTVALAGRPEVRHRSTIVARSRLTLASTEPPALAAAAAIPALTSRNLAFGRPPPSLETELGADVQLSALARSSDFQVALPHLDVGPVSVRGRCTAPPRFANWRKPMPLPAPNASLKGDAFGRAVARAALNQSGGIVIYSAKYQSMPFPMGDLPPMLGSCTEVVIRAYRRLGYDLQAAIQRARVGSGDRNIDHRRTNTLRKLFARAGAELPISPYPEDYRPGDIVTYYRPFSRVSRAHIAIVSDRIAPTGRPYIIHNRGYGVQLEDALFVDKMTGHYRFRPLDALPDPNREVPVAGLSRRGVPENASGIKLLRATIPAQPTAGKRRATLKQSR